MLNGLDPDQDQCFVSPDWGPNCLKRLIAENKSQGTVNSEIFVRILFSGIALKDIFAMLKICE